MRIHQEKKIVECMVVTNKEYEMISRVRVMFENVANDAEDAQFAADAQEAADCITYMQNNWIEIDD